MDDALESLRLARRACEVAGLRPERDAAGVLELAETDPELWPVCCQGGCEPCTERMQSAALWLRRQRVP